MSGWIDINGPVEGTSVYDSGTLVARDVTLNLPAVTFGTAELKAMGTLTMPILGQVEHMEASLTKIGLDKGLRSLVKMESRTLEYRWIQIIKQSDDSNKRVGCKAFLRGTPTGIPGLTGEPASSTDSDVTFGVTRYELFVDGEEYWCIDKLATICRIDGTDYAKDMNSLL